MSGNRRAFLNQLVTLPLIGGSVALIGQPTAVAEPPSVLVLEAYKTWLDNERRWLSRDMAANPAVQRLYGCFPRSVSEEVRFAKMIDSLYAASGPAWNYHDAAARPATRAALILSAAGCDLPI